MSEALPDQVRAALEAVLDIQREINAAADHLRRPRVDLLSAEEEARVRELIAAETWPDGWTGEEPRADTPMDAVSLVDGRLVVQPLLPGCGGGRR